MAYSRQQDKHRVTEAFNKEDAAFNFSRSGMPRELEGLWEGPWPYIGYGVGLLLEGLPTSMMKFEEVLCSEGCSPHVVSKIIERLQEKGYSKQTVQNDIRFRRLHKELANLDVKMSVIPPKQN